MMSPPDSLSVRDALPSDAESIARVHVDAWRETYSGVLADHHFSEEVFESRKRFWTAYLSRPPKDARLVVAESAGTLVGFANSGKAAGPDAERGFPVVRPLQLFTIYLLAAAQGSGFGQMMLEAVLAEKPAQLWVLQGNQRAVAFYQRNGFTPDGVEFTDPSEPGLVEMRMVR